MNLVQFKRHDGDGDVFINPAHVAMVDQSGTGDANVTDVVVVAQAGLALVRVHERISAFCSQAPTAPRTRHEQVEQGRAPTLLPHHGELAWHPADDLRDHRRPHRQHTNRRRVSGTSGTRRRSVPYRRDGDQVADGRHRASSPMSFTATGTTNSILWTAPAPRPLHRSRGLPDAPILRRRPRAPLPFHVAHSFHIERIRVNPTRPPGCAEGHPRAPSTSRSTLGGRPPDSDATRQALDALIVGDARISSPRRVGLRGSGASRAGRARSWSARRRRSGAAGSAPARRASARGR